MGKPTIIVDFDGVIHTYVTKWTDARTIPDPPVTDAIKWLTEAVERFDVCIFSSRSGQDGGIAAMREYLLEHGLSQEVMELLKFPTAKPAAIMTIDDRAFCFKGAFPPLNWIESFKPWNR